MRLRECRSAVVPIALVLAAACASPDAEPAATPAGPTVLARGGPFRGTNGILFGPDGRLWVASVATPVLAALDPETGEILERLGPDEGVEGPDDLAFGPDGSVFWTDINIGTVGRRSPDGTSKVVADLGPGVNPITFSDDGRLFVSQCFYDDRLFEVDPEGVKEPRLISDDLGPGCGLNGMDWGADGMLYGPRWFQGSVVKVDVDSGEYTTVADGFGVPAAVKFDSKGRLHVLDSMAGEVVRIGENGEREVVAHVEPSSADNLAFDRDDRLFVSSFGGGWIVEALDAESDRTVVGSGLNMPGGLARVDGASGPRLYVADFFALRGLDPATGEEVYAAHDIIGFSDIGSVMTVAARGDELLLTSWYDNAVKIWNPAANERVAAFDGFARPVDATALGDEIVVTEYDTGSVIRFDPADPENRVAIATGLEEPAGLAVVGEDVYVTDRGAGRVVQVLDDGEIVAPPREVAAGLAGPEGLAPCGESLLVVEADGGRLSRVGLDGKSETLADGLELQIPTQGGFPSTMFFNGVACDEGHAYVTGDRANVIYSIPL